MLRICSSRLPIQATARPIPGNLGFKRDHLYRLDEVLKDKFVTFPCGCYKMWLAQDGKGW